MSTVLRPVGDLPPRVYWVRRGFILLGILVLILVIAESCAGGGSGTPSANRPRVTATGSQSPGPPQPCAAGQVRLTVTSDKTNYAIGETPVFTGVFTNISSTPCTITEAPAQEQWTVTSGPATIWTTVGCVSSHRAKTKTIRPGQTRSVSITWDGKQYDKCQPSADVKNGQYVMRAKLDGFMPAQGQVFDMSNSSGG